ncbi:MAG: nucleoside triphosphate pyrophosphohydrolase family protein [Clostridia bacterium]|nr:nucleoside triphosphate pyrophosphohydrolase family protein [Clostridia bacterium]
MNLNEYQKLAMRTSPDGHDRVRNGCLGLIGESGEIVDVIKKWMFQSVKETPLPVEKLIDEMGDVLWYCAETATGMRESLRLLAGELETNHWHHACRMLDLEQTVTSMSSCANSAYNAYYVAINPNGAVDNLCGVLALLMHLCDMVDTSIEIVAENNIAKLKKRYPDGFDPERSMNRPEYTTLPHKEQAESVSGSLLDERSKPV